MATLNLRNDIYYANYSRGGRQIRLSLRTGDFAEAEARLRALTQPADGDVEPPATEPYFPERPWGAVIAEGLANSGGWLAAMYQRTKDRARHKKVGFHLTKAALREIARRSEGRCELTGIPFSWDKMPGALFPPYAPSLDRITPATGYNADNCRLICYAANMALADWGEAVFRQMALAYLARKPR